MLQTVDKTMGFLLDVLTELETELIDELFLFWSEIFGDVDFNVDVLIAPRSAS